MNPPAENPVEDDGASQPAADGGGKAPAGAVVLISSDVDMFRFIFEHRFLRREHLHALTGRSPKRLHRRLFDLEKHGYLTTVRLPMQKFIYGLREPAVSVLVEEGVAAPGLLGKRIRVHELAWNSRPHEMMIVDIHVMLSLASRLAPLKLAKWREGPVLYDSVEVSDRHGTRRVSVRPDGFFEIEDSRRQKPANIFYFTLEADRQRGKHDTFGEKLIGYWNYIEQRRYVKKYQIESPFRVLTVTRKALRAENLSGLVRKTLPEKAWKYFLFASIEQFTLQNPAVVFADVWLSPRAPDLHPLVSAPRDQLVAEAKRNV